MLPFNKPLVFSVVVAWVVYDATRSHDVAAKTEPSECDGYTRIEEVKKCGLTGYPLHYGNPNCRRFEAGKSSGRYDGAGVQWIGCTLTCLVDHLEAFVKNNPDSSCTDVKASAFSSHVPCYVKCGFCQACKTNKWALWKTYALRDFASWDVMGHVVDIASECGLTNCFSE